MASEIWFLPVIFVFFLIFKPPLPTAIITIVTFFSTLLPQVLFDFRHDHIMLKAISDHFANSSEPSFVFSLGSTVNRLRFYYSAFSESLGIQENLFFYFLMACLPGVIFIQRHFNYSKLLLLSLFLFPLLVLLFYRGNEGNFYSYYLMGIFPLLVILLSAAIGFYVNRLYLLPLFLLSIYLFSPRNIINLKNFLIAGVDGPQHISLGNQLQSVDWVYQQAGSIPFNVDVYVPPVIPYSYDYLFMWRGQSLYKDQPDKNLTPLLFTLYEVDEQHPQFLDNWLKRQSTIGKIEEETRFGGITVQRRTRINP